MFNLFMADFLQSHNFLLVCWKNKLNIGLVRALNQFANLARFKYFCILLESS